MELQDRIQLQFVPVIRSMDILLSWLLGQLVPKDSFVIKLYKMYSRRFLVLVKDGGPSRVYNCITLRMKYDPK